MFEVGFNVDYSLVIKFLSLKIPFKFVETELYSYVHAGIFATTLLRLKLVVKTLALMGQRHRNLDNPKFITRNQWLKFLMG